MIHSRSLLAGASALVLLTAAQGARAETVTTTLSFWQALVGSFTEITSYGTDFTTTSAVDLAGNPMSLSDPASIRTVGSTWATWSGSYLGQVLYTGLNTLTLTFPTPIKAIGFFTEPNIYDTFKVTFETENTKVSQLINGDAGAKFWGWVGDVGEKLVSVTISADSSFAVGDFYVAAVPGPLAGAGLPGVLALLGYGLWRRRLAG